MQKGTGSRANSRGSQCPPYPAAAPCHERLSSCLTPLSRSVFGSAQDCWTPEQRVQAFTMHIASPSSPKSTTQGGASPGWYFQQWAAGSSTEPSPAKGEPNLPPTATPQNNWGPAHPQHSWTTRRSLLGPQQVSYITGTIQENTATSPCLLHLPQHPLLRSMHFCDLRKGYKPENHRKCLSGDTGKVCRAQPRHR